jgi:GDP-4-dehydro-6-deoxy-D-mannose reductase
MAAVDPRRILMTGASGFVGRHLLSVLVTSFPGVQIFAQRIDVTDRDAVSQAVRDARPDACIHLAAITSVTGAKRDEAQTWRVNLDGTLNLARAVLAHAPDCHLLFASSAEIYGRSFQSSRRLDETALLAPVNSYAATKAAADLALGAMADDGLRVVRLRLFNHTGPGQSEAFVVPAFARQIARIEAGHQPPRLHAGALDSRRDFLDVRDVGSAYLTCLRLAPELLPGTIVNIASGIPRRIGDILDELMDIAGLHAEIVIDGARLRSSEIVTASGDAARAHQLLGWTPKTPWTQTLADVLADWRKLTANTTGVPTCPPEAVARN